MELEVRIYQVLPAQEGVSQQGNRWMRQSFVAETLEAHERKICFSVMGEEVIKRIGVANLKPGDHKKVFFSIRAQEYNGRWYNEVNAYDIRETDAAIQQAPSMAI